jgi:TolB-like protein
VSPAVGPLAVAVLPFENLTGDPEGAAFSDGMTEEVMNALAHLPGLRVAARNSSFTFQGQRASLGEVGERLHVTHVVEGTVRRAAGRVRITARLEQVSTGSQVWSEGYEEALSDVFRIQERVARAIADALRVKRGAVDLTRGGTSSAPAFEAYLQGRHAWSQRPRQGPAALAAYETAVRLDSGFGQAWAGLAAAYATMGSWEDGSLAPRDAFPKAEAAAQRALAIDPALAEAHWTLGYALAHFDRAYEAAEREFLLARTLRPDDPESHHWYSHLLIARGRREEALAESRRTQELDPLDPVHSVHLAWQYIFSGQLEQARAFCLERPGGFPGSFWQPWFLGLALRELGQPAEALRVLSTGAERDPLRARFTPLASQRALTLASLGRQDEVRAIEAALTERAKSTYVPAYDLALLRLARGDLDGTVQLLERTADERSAWAIYLAVDPRLAPLRGRPRFRQLLERVGLADVAPPTP